MREKIRRRIGKLVTKYGSKFLQDIEKWYKNRDKRLILKVGLQMFGIKERIG